MVSIRKIAGIVLAGLVLVLTVISVLSIWEIIDFDFRNVLTKSFYSLSVIFIGTLLLLFIFSVLVKGEETRRPPSINP